MKRGHERGTGIQVGIPERQTSGMVGLRQEEFDRVSDKTEIAIEEKLFRKNKGIKKQPDGEEQQPDSQEGLRTAQEISVYNSLKKIHCMKAHEPRPRWLIPQLSVVFHVEQHGE